MTKVADDRFDQVDSLVFMPPMLPHAIAAKSPVKMLLVEIKSGKTK